MLFYLIDSYIMKILAFIKCFTTNVVGIGNDERQKYDIKENIPIDKRGVDGKQIAVWNHGHNILIHPIELRRISPNRNIAFFAVNIRHSFVSVHEYIWLKTYVRCFSSGSVISEKRTVPNGISIGIYYECFAVVSDSGIIHP